MTNPRTASGRTRPPPPAVAAAVVAVLGGLLLLWLGVVQWALGGLDTGDTGDTGRAWALLPLAAGAAVLVGGIGVLRRRGQLLLAVGVVLAVAFVVVLAVQTAGLDEGPPVGVALVVLAGPVLALLLLRTPRARSWLAGAR
jgi:peptidoglycan/LPS O-acetylase OafA/YrhL